MTTGPSDSLRRTPSNAQSGESDEKNKNSRGPLRSIITLVRMASVGDQLLLLSGCLLGILNGFGWPLINYLTASFSNVLSDLLIGIRSKDISGLTPCLQNDTSTNSSLTHSDLNHSAYFPVNATGSRCNESGYLKEQYRLPDEDVWINQILKFTFPALGVAFLVIITRYLYGFILNTVSERIVLHIKKLYLKSVLRQNVAWLDSRSHGEITASIMRSMGLIQMALGEKLGMLMVSLSVVFTSFVFCFYYGWKLTLVLSCLYPTLKIIGKIINKINHSTSKKIRNVNGELAGLVQEVLSAIRTVMAFGGQEKEFNSYLDRLEMSRKINKKMTIITGMNFSIIFLISQGFSSLGFWYGLKLMRNTEAGEDNYTPRDVLLINTLILVSGLFIRVAVPLLDLIGIGFNAAVEIVDVILRTPEIDSYCHQGITLQRLRGNIEFRNVHFGYPTSLDEKKILKGLNLKINSGEAVALVGPSGAGKSTLLHLIQRFYDPQSGKIKIDDTNLEEFNIGWFRRNVGVVSQEPVLFNTTIRENIRFGNESATNEDIIRASKEANAHDFIMKLPQQYDTLVGEQGSQMSGGERQRIAIARALVRNPSILLLDEATSALDNESEVIVQESLDKARRGRTTIVIAHRLSTIRNTDRIVAIKGGRVVEQGTHEELTNRSNGVYKQLLLAQMCENENGQVAEPTDDEETFCADDESQNYDVLESEKEEDDDSDVKYPEYIESSMDNEKAEQSEIDKAFWKILYYSKDDWVFIFCAMFFDVITGIYHSARSIVYALIAHMIVVKDFHDIPKTILYPCLYTLVGFIAFIAFSLKAWSYSRAEENLLFRVRQKAMDSILQQEIGWFDDRKSSVTNLVSLLTFEAENAKHIAGTIVGTWTYTIVGTALLALISIAQNWRLALVTSVISVSNFVSNYLNVRINRGSFLALQKSEERANNLAIESIKNIRTVISLHIENVMCQRYNEAVGDPRSFLDRQIHLRSMVSALADGSVIIGFTVALTYGAYLMYHEMASYFDYQLIFSMLIVNILELAQVLANCPERNKASLAAYKLLRIIKRKPIVDTHPAAGLVLPNNIKTKITFRDIRFSYPSRPTDTVLQGFNLNVEEGQTVALVGRSGCGKSTCFRLLQRFYDPDRGIVTISGYDLRCVNVPSLRSHMGIVSQEPTLFNRTIKENIMYGANHRDDVSMDEVIDAAKQANIHEFISSLRQSYETRLGPRGVQLSGGQKQRVAIARALIRNPRILLLDEATSALDNESEKMVQEALEKAREGRTCLVIAHRLSTIQNADQIVVLDRGQVVEKGSPQELYEKEGMYYEHMQIQSGKIRRLSRPAL